MDIQLYEALKDSAQCGFGGHYNKTVKNQRKNFESSKINFSHTTLLKAINSEISQQKS